jgi:DNA-binding CsgD family transcriptional regulator
MHLQGCPRCNGGLVHGVDEYKAPETRCFRCGWMMTGDVPPPSKNTLRVAPEYIDTDAVDKAERRIHQLTYFIRHAKPYAEMRREGASYEEIAAHYGTSHHTVARYIQRLVDREGELAAQKQWLAEIKRSYETRGRP